MATITKSVFADPVEFARTWLHVIDKTDTLIPLHYNRAQLHYLENRTSRDLILKARQLGFSTMMQAELFRFAVTGMARTVTLSHKDTTTQAFRRMADNFYYNLPDQLRPERKYSNARITTYPGFGSEAMIATAGGKGTGHGLTTAYQHWSEVALWPRAEEVVGGIMQAGTPKWIVAESTPNGARGWFYERCMESLDGNNAWQLHFYPWWWDTDYRLPLAGGEMLEYTDDEARLALANNLTPEQIKWRRTKQDELRDLFPQAYPEDPLSCFLRSGNAYFGDVSGCYVLDRVAPGDIADARYYAGLDFGQSIDYTVCSVKEKTTKREVALLRINRMQWGEMRRRVRLLCEEWGVSILVPETNSMTTNIEELHKEFKKHGTKTKIVPFTMTAESKRMLVSNWHEALHGGGWKMLGTPEQKEEYRAFVAKQNQLGNWSYEAESGSHDDIVIANMLAYHAAHVRPQNVSKQTTTMRAYA